MNILIISSNAKPISGDYSFGMLNEFKKRGHFVKIFTNYYDGKHDDIISNSERPENRIDLFRKRVKILLSGIFRRPAVNDRYYFQDIYETVTFCNSKTILKKAGIKPDIIFLHFNQNFINARNLYELNKLTGAPVFILLMDMAPMTGGCHYAWDCEGYKEACGNCPGLRSAVRHDLSFRNLNYRRKYFERTNLHIIAASSWQYKQAKESTVFRKKPIIKILSAFDTQLFKPGDKQVIRKKLNLPADKKIIFFGAAGIEEERKGLHLLIKALDALDKSQVKGEIFLLLAGNTSQDFLNNLKFPYSCLGFLNYDGLSEAYQASDVYVCPSVEDSGPTMINQAILCGLPVVSFKMGVAADLIINGKTGYIVQMGNYQELSEKIEAILKLDAQEYNILSDNCRTTGKSKCNPEFQINEYEKIFSKPIVYGK